MWKDLTQDQKAEIMDLYLSKGITSLSQIRDFYDSALQDNTFGNGGKIHIKPENRGKFTALKERTSHSSTWFKEHGTPAQKKMAVFALNARKWKHSDGGQLLKNDETYNKEKEYTPGPIQQLARTFARKVIAPGYHYVTGNLIDAGRKAAFINDGPILSNPSNLYDMYDSGGIPQSTYLMPREWQKDAFLKAGYIEGKKGDYGLVKKAVGNRNLPVYQTAKDAISRDELTHIGNVLNHSNSAYSENDLYHAGYYSTAFYMDDNNNFYTKSWDLNDYEDDNYGGIYRILTKGLDALEKPVVVTTGFQKVLPPTAFSYNDVVELNNSKHFLPNEYTDLLNKYMETKGLQKMYKIKGDIYNEKEYLNKYPDNYDEDSHTFLNKNIFYTLPEVVIEGRKKF